MSPSTADRRSSHPRVHEFLEAYSSASESPGQITPQQQTHLLDLTTQLSRMHVEDQPFTAGTVDGFLPPALYTGVLQSWPLPEDLSTAGLPSTAGSGDAYLGSRKTKLIESWEESRTTATDHLSQLSLALRSASFVQALFWRFADTIEANLAHVPEAERGRPNFRLYLNSDAGEKEALGAHVDALRKLLTIVIYLDLSGDTDATSPFRWGTSLYEAEANAVRPVTFTSNAEYAVARSIEFEANRAFIMPNDSRALHGVAGGQTGVTRRTIMCGYWLLSPR